MLTLLDNSFRRLREASRAGTDPVEQASSDSSRRKGCDDTGQSTTFAVGQASGICGNRITATDAIGQVLSIAACGNAISCDTQVWHG